ncbi:MAG: hypothetical protein EPO68_15445 [Planctomycetota bacterium]|nr:MAG: hypothetical protein EPO68_15445 [Planctomycetota bacterium]
MSVTPPAPRSALRLAALWFAIAFAVRLCVACSRSDELELELYTGTFGWSLIQGMPLDPERLPIIDHLRGSALFGVLVVPLQWLFGPQLFALKLLACGWGAAHAALFGALARRWFGPSAGWLAVLLLAFAPPSYQMVGVLALGSHEAVGLWIALALFALIWRPGAEPLAADGASVAPDGAARAAVAAAPRAELSAARALAFGAVCGCGVLFSLQFVVALPAIACAWLALDPRAPLRPRTWLALAGAAPLLACIRLLSTQGKLVTAKPEDHLQFADLGANVQKFFALVPDGLRRSWLYAEQGLGWVSWVVLAALALGLVATIARARRRDALALYALVHPLAYSIAHALTDFELNFDNTLDGIGSRYLMPFWPALALWIVFGVRMLRTRFGPLPAAAFGAAPVLAGVLGVVALSDPLHITREPRVRGLDAPGFGFHLRYASGGSLERHWELAAELDPDWLALRPLALETPRIDAEFTLAELRDEVRRAQALSNGARSVRFVEIGAWIVRTKHYEAAPALEQLDEADRIWLWRGAGRELGMQCAVKWLQLARSNDNLEKLLSDVPPTVRPWVIEGAGVNAGLRLTPYNPPAIDLIAQGAGLGPRLRPIYFRAAGLAYRTRYFAARYFVPRDGVLRVESMMPSNARLWFREGLRMPLENQLDTEATPTLPVAD